MWIMPKEIAIGSTVYSCNLLKKLIVMGFFMHQNTFPLPESQRVSIPWAVFSTQTESGK